MSSAAGLDIKKKEINKNNLSFIFKILYIFCEVIKNIIQINFGNYKIIDILVISI
ncbi:hypothetical protein OBPA_16990 [Polaribacter sp. OB-PA-B3]